MARSSSNCSIHDYMCFNACIEQIVGIAQHITSLINRRSTVRTIDSTHVSCCHRLNELMVSRSVLMPSLKMELVAGGVLDREVGTYRRENLPDSFPLT